MLGDIKYTAACGACGPAVSAAASCVGEFGNEWAFDGPGECNTCSFNCVNFGLLGTACTVGTHAKCKRVSFSGDKTACCLGKPTAGTCDPTYTAASGQCDAVYASYCDSARIVNDPRCIGWRNVRPAASLAAMQKFCTANIGDPVCKEWCKLQIAQGNNVCDAAVATWCDLHPTDAYCTCVKSPLQDPRYGINPKCNDRACIATGYMTQNMKNTNCPDITNCDIQAKMVNSGIQLAGVTINQNCGKPAPTVTATSSVGVSSSTVGPIIPVRPPTSTASTTPTGPSVSAGGNANAGAGIGTDANGVFTVNNASPPSNTSGIPSMPNIAGIFDMSITMMIAIFVIIFAVVIAIIFAIMRSRAPQ